MRSSSAPRAIAAAVRLRLRAQHLVRRAPAGSLVDVVRDLCGVQAQVSSAAALALWARVEGLTPAAVEAALWEARSLVRVWAMRGTLHLLAAEDVPVFARALGPLDAGGSRRWLRRSGFSEAEIERLTAAIVDALAGGPLARRALAERVAARLDAPAAALVREWIDHGWGGLVKVASQEGAVVGGPSRGQEVTFVRRDRWLPEVTGDGEVALTPERAGEVLVRRFRRGYGPATVQDFAFWAGVNQRDVRPLWERVAPAGEVAAGEEALPEPPPVRLLPAFDPYVLAYKDKSVMVAAADYKRVFRAAAWVSPVVPVDGRVAGVWSHRRSGRRLRVLVEPFGAPPAATVRGVEAEADALGRFLDAPATVEWA
jgi:hypothetical protein